MKNKFVKFLFAILLVVGVTIAFSKYGFKSDKTSKISINKWENMYSGQNIHFYYQDIKDINIQQIAENYNFKELFGDEKDEFKKALKLMEWLRQKVEYEPNNMSKEGFAMEILKKAMEGENGLNDKDYCSVYTELGAAAGLNIRKGELKVKDADKEKKKFNHYICEVWSEKYNKWIMLDPCNCHYITYDGKPISTVEALKKGLDSVEILGQSNSKKYIKDMKKYFYSYTIAIDNRIYGDKKINSYITYIKPGEVPEVYIKGKTIDPTIFVNKNTLLDISPKVDYDRTKNKKLDDIGTLIFSQKKNKNDNNNSKNDSIQLYGGVFKDSMMEGKYYISINNEQWKEIDGYFEVTLKNGENSIRLSSDEKKVEREVIINYKEK